MQFNKHNAKGSNQGNSACLHGIPDGVDHVLGALGVVRLIPPVEVELQGGVDVTETPPGQLHAIVQHKLHCQGGEEE